MHKMPDYGFYKDVYLGTSVPQNAFAELLARATQWLGQLERCCRVEPYGTDSRKMALCAAAETLYTYRQRLGIAQTSVGGVSVSYEKNADSVQRQLLRAVSGYLEIYRGVG